MLVRERMSFVWAPLRIACTGTELWRSEFEKTLQNLTALEHQASTHAALAVLTGYVATAHAAARE